MVCNPNPRTLKYTRGKKLGGHAQIPVEVLGEGVPLQVALVEPPPHRVVAFGPVARGGSATRTLKVLLVTDSLQTGRCKCYEVLLCRFATICTKSSKCVSLLQVHAFNSSSHLGVRLQVINRSRATASLSFAEAAAALKQFSISLLPVGMVALRPRDTVEVKLMFR